MMQFEYYIELKDGYKIVMDTEKTNEMVIIISAPNRVTADRMIKAMLSNDNIKDYSGICIR